MSNEVLQELANDLFQELVTNTKGPMDAAEVLLYMHLMLWNSQEEKVASAETMLDSFKIVFLEYIGEGPTIQ